MKYHNYSACWSVEFLEHVGRQYINNYMETFRSCAMVFATKSGWGGWHHVEVCNTVNRIVIVGWCRCDVRFSTVIRTVKLSENQF